MTTLTLTPTAALATVTLTLASAPAGAVTITRVDANGTASVRLLSGAAPISGAMVVTDHEAAMVGLIRYDVRDSAGATVSASTTLALAATPPIMIRSVQRPSIAATPRLILQYDAARPSPAVTHDPIDRPDPLPVFGRPRARAGSMQLLALTYADALAVDRAVNDGAVMMLRQGTHPGMDMYFYAAGPTRTTHLQHSMDGWRWGITIDYREVASPALPLLGTAGWSYADVTANYPDFASVRTAFTDYASLTAGTP